MGKIGEIAANPTNRCGLTHAMFLIVNHSHRVYAHCIFPKGQLGTFLTSILNLPSSFGTTISNNCPPYSLSFSDFSRSSSQIGDWDETGMFETRRSVKTKPRRRWN